jgi:hypothetical protein
MYRNETVLYGEHKGTSLDTLDKALSYICWQYQTTHLLTEEFYHAVHLARAEFKRRSYARKH